MNDVCNGARLMKTPLKYMVFDHSKSFCDIRTIRTHRQKPFIANGEKESLKKEKMASNMQQEDGGLSAMVSLFSTSSEVEHWARVHGELSHPIVQRRLFELRTRQSLSSGRRSESQSRFSVLRLNTSSIQITLKLRPAFYT